MVVKRNVGELAKVERAQVMMFHSKVGLARSDAKHMLFLPVDRFGSGYRSIVVEHLKALARETVVMLNDRIESGPCLRARLQAARADPPNYGYTGTWRRGPGEGAW